MRALCSALLIAVCASACSASDDSPAGQPDATLDSTTVVEDVGTSDTATSDVVIESDSEVGSNPPAPPTPEKLPDDVLAQLRKTDAGLPILIESNATTEPGRVWAIGYDDKIADPVAHLASCLDRVVGCRKTNKPGLITGCIPLIPVCADPAGGDACCPKACIEQFLKARADGVSESDALKQVFRKGHCVPGIAAIEGSTP